MVKKSVAEKFVCKGGSSSSNAVYGIGFIGSLVYFLQHSSGVNETLLGIVKAIFWPGVLVYKAFELLGF